MLFKRREKERNYDPEYNDVIVKIRREIIQSLRNKGISFSDIDVDLRQENVSFTLSMNEK
ncbi:hypothetical protein [Acetivibrio clariflavus]|uniref:Uncharacterized protein n=1 Tax=Acetivibrio clariflavus (strain DSM 19732 / NBRC 101661 / EBR45) TaxID=720554 RepID=G8LYY0_ACECE|nr:hypothetical protein [Acetivibrio clariflavus]AEV67882.1 hypothetical protein Clocl_1221 [Acetivibrio clariflavus DSM 19732]HOP99808.1 hypothetical protein [Acetivibrio clariflavus]HPU41125.1 hypothetical protein [Acetivibrio clariflavus]